MRAPDAKHSGTLPNAAGAIARLAYAKSKEAGVDLALLLKKAGLTLHQIEDPDVRLKVKDQIGFLNLAADALNDDLLGFHLAQSPDLRELGALYYVSASSEMLGIALQRTGCRRALCWNLIWRNLQRHEVIGSGGEVNWVIDSRCGKRLPAVDLAHVDLAGGEQRPEQHASSLC